MRGHQALSRQKATAERSHRRCWWPNKLNVFAKSRRRGSAGCCPCPIWAANGLTENRLVVTWLDFAYKSAHPEQCFCIVLLDPQLSGGRDCPFGCWLLVFSQAFILCKSLWGFGDQMLRSGGTRPFVPFVDSLPSRRRPVFDQTRQ